MKHFPLLFIGSLLLTPLSAEAQRPSRRAILEQGEQILEQSKQVKLQNQVNADVTEYEDHVIPLLGIAFEKPANNSKNLKLWDVSSFETDRSAASSDRISDGDYVVLTEERHEEAYSIFIYSKRLDEIATIDSVKEEWERQQRQPDHDNVYEYSNLGFIRELNVIRTDDITYMGKPAILTEYTFSNWSKFWHGTAIMFPHGNEIYTIKYRRERDTEDRFYHVYQHLLDTFRFLNSATGAKADKSAKVFNDVAANHKNARAIERLKDLGIVGGYGDGSFKPESTINRAEFIKIMTSEPLVPVTELATCDVSTLSFPDVPKDTWYAPHVCVAVARGMIGGYPDGTFRGSNTISFAEAAKIIATFFAEGDIPTDSEQWYRPFIAVLSGRRAIPLSVEAPGSLVRRDVMSEIIYRLYDRIENKDSRSEADFRS